MIPSFPAQELRTNTTNAILKQVRVEVHLSNGVELGPTTPADLYPGQIRPISLAATSSSFDRWNAHPEVGTQTSTEQGGAEGAEGGHDEGTEGSGSG